MVQMTDWSLPWEGGCRCGQVRLKVSVPPIVTLACHCTGCQKMSASAFSLTAIIPQEGFAVTSGVPIIGGLHGIHKQLFCPYCMSWLYTKVEGSPVVGLRATMLDDPRWFSPFIEIMTSEKLPWVTTSAAHHFDKFPTMDEFSNMAKLYAEHRAR